MYLKEYWLNSVRLKMRSCNSSFSLFCVFLFVFYRSMRLRAVKSTKRESSSSSWLTWSRTTGGSDAPAALCLFLTLEWSLMNCVERRPSTTLPLPDRPPPQKTPPRTSTPRLLHVHTSTCSSWKWTERKDDEEAESKRHTRHRSPVVTLKMCVFSFAAPELLGLTPAHSLSTPPPSAPTEPRLQVIVVIRRPLCERDRLHWKDISLLSLIRPSSETNDFDDFRCFNVICYSFNFWGLVRFWFDGRWMLLVSILFSCQVCHALFCFICCFWLVVSMPVAERVFLC